MSGLQAHLAGYRVVRLLGQGAMGRVFEAEDPELGRRVAIKVLGQDPSGQRSERFRREGELAARLEHPGIVRVHAAGVEGDQRYIVYELVSGAQPLDEAWAEVGLRQRIRWTRDVARAIGYAHEQGIVHRDLKPENILVDAAGGVRITDFGIAGASDLERLTKTGVLVGTPTHMAPEQMTGGSRPGPATDVWALGVILYQALCDELPFEGHDWLSLATLVAEGRFRPPSDSRSEVPPDLERICARALQTDPALRPPNGAALAELLDGWLAGEELEPRRRGPGLGLAAAGLLAILASGLAAAWALAPASPPGSRSAEASPPQALAPSPLPTASSGTSLAEVSRDLRKAEQGPERLAAYRAARDYLKGCQDLRERRLLLRRLVELTREPLAELMLEVPASVGQVSLNAAAWGDRVLVGAKGSACLIDPLRLACGPWGRCYPGSFVPLSPRRGLSARGEVIREGETLRFRESREDFRAPPTRLLSQTLTSGGRFLATGRQSLAWGTKQTLEGTMKLDFPPYSMAASPEGGKVALGCALATDNAVKYEVRLQLYSLGARPRLILERPLVSRVRALRWVDEDLLVIGQLVGSILIVDVPSQALWVEVGPTSSAPALPPMGGVTHIVAGQDTILAICRDGLLGWWRGGPGREQRELVRIPWDASRGVRRVYGAAEHEGLLWLFTKEGEVMVYSARIADYVAQAQDR